jgi:chemotaxis protein methyltransferase CheR
MSIGAIEFDYLRKLVKDFSAIDIDLGKEYLAELRLTRLLPDEGCQSVQELLHRLRIRSVGGMHHKVVDAMTNNETWFFRDCHPFQVLGDLIIPELMAKRTAEHRLTFWSAACSSGQEPYSIAMLLREKFAFPNWKFAIRATDISTVILDRAKKGTYSQMEINRGLPATHLTKYFVKNGLRWDLKPEVKQMVNFEPINLAQPWINAPAVDVIFLRNVLIYFEIEIRRQILAKVRRVLRPGGYLILGGAETTMNIDSNFERVRFEKCACYQLKS